MKFKKINQIYLIKLEKGEEIISTLTKFTQAKKIKFGTVSGIGGLKQTTLKYYDLNQKKYLTKKFTRGNYELLSLTGNLTWIQKKPIVHLHAVLSDSHYHSFGGHLDSAVISITGEIIITPANKIINRTPNQEFNLNFWQL